MSNWNPDMTSFITGADLADEQWKKDAACAGCDTEEFFPEKTPSATVKRICASCPVQNDCIEYAIKYNLDGVWGGTGWITRHKIRQRRQKITL